MSRRAAGCATVSRVSVRQSTVDALLARVRTICFDFAGTEEKLSHGAPFFHVRGRGIVSFANEHHGDGHVAVWCKATLDAQKRLVAKQPDVYFVPPYVGVKGWVGMRLEHPAMDFDALAMLVEEAWRSVVPKRLEHAEPTEPSPPPTYPTTDPAVVEAALAKLTTMCEGLADVHTERSGYSVTFRVGRKPFAYLFDNHHRDGIVGVGVRVPLKEAAALVKASPRRYYMPPYIGPKGWVAMRVDDARVPWKELARRIVDSHTLASARK